MMELQKAGMAMEFEFLKNVTEQFVIEGNVLKVEPYGNGHINDTYRVETSVRYYLLQRINKNVFKQPENLMQNIKQVTEFVRQQVIQEFGDVYRETLNLIEGVQGECYVIDEEGEYWRMYVYIDNAYSFDLVEKVEDFYQSALAFGKFQKQLQQFPAESLHYTIENFHHTPSRYKTFEKTLKADSEDRAKTAEAEIAFVKERKAFTSLLWDLHDKGDLALKVSHNDTKLNNVLIDKETREALCVIDLDTVMPGFVLDDFGDAIRFGASTGEEDEKDLTKVNFDIKLYQTFVEGFLKGADGSITQVEAIHFPEGAKMLTLECGIRFLTDYLDGDHYFKTAYADHNLVRARTQFKLVADMEQQWEEMKKIAIETYNMLSLQKVTFFLSNRSFS